MGSTLLTPFIRQYEKLSQDAENVVLKRIEVLCRRYKWRFSSVGFGYNVERADGSEIYSKKIDDLLSSYGDHFGNVGFYVCESGEWIEGQTPLIQFDKPSFAYPKHSKKP